MDLEYRETEIVYEIKYICDGHVRITDVMPNALIHAIQALRMQEFLILSIRIRD